MKKVILFVAMLGACAVQVQPVWAIPGDEQGQDDNGQGQNFNGQGDNSQGNQQ